MLFLKRNRLRNPWMDFKQNNIFIAASLIKLIKINYIIRIISVFLIFSSVSRSKQNNLFIFTDRKRFIKHFRFLFSVFFVKKLINSGHTRRQNLLFINAPNLGEEMSNLFRPCNSVFILSVAGIGTWTSCITPAAVTRGFETGTGVPELYNCCFFFEHKPIESRNMIIKNDHCTF